MSSHQLTHQTDVATPLGRMLLARDARGLCGVWFEGQKYHPGTLTVPRDDQDPILKQAADWLGAYFAGRTDIERGVMQEARREGPAAALPPLSLNGTDFQQAVWRELLQIPFGHTVSYGDLAARLGRREAVRAVAAAVGRNPISVLVPCHRVVGGNGQLTGYAGGLDRKRALLGMEAQAPFAGEALSLSAAEAKAPLVLEANAPFKHEAQARFSPEASVPVPLEARGIPSTASLLASEPTAPPLRMGWTPNDLTPATGSGSGSGPDSPPTTRSSGPLFSSHLQGAGA